jgi:molybdopterin-binding protein
VNRISAAVTAVESVENIMSVSFDASGQPMRMMALELNRALQPGVKVVLGVKASNIALAKELGGSVSIANRLDTVIERVTEGALLCSVKLRLEGETIESIISRESYDRMDLRPGDRVTALIKASELSILELPA